MFYSESERQILLLLDRVGSEYAALERNEYPGTDNDRSVIHHNLETVRNIIRMRASVRNDKEAKSNEHL